MEKYDVSNSDSSSNELARTFRTISPESKGDTETIVGWDGPDDPESPRNWSKKRRWTVTAIVSLYTFIRSVSGTCQAINRLTVSYQPCGVVNLVTGSSRDFQIVGHSSGVYSREHVSLDICTCLCSWGESRTLNLGLFFWIKPSSTAFDLGASFRAVRTTCHFASVQFVVLR